MKFKKEYLILVLVIVALSLYLVMRSKDQAHFELPELAAVESKTINRLVITRAGKAIELNKKDARWYITPGDYPADDIKVNNMLKAAADLTVSALVSESQNYQRYDLDDDQKISLQALAGNDLLRGIDIGRVAPTFQHTFVRLDGDTRVYHARGNINRTFDQTGAELRDKDVLNFESDAITSLTIQKGARSLALEKKETPAQEEKGEVEQPPKIEWLAANGQAADVDSVQKLLDGFSTVKCDGYLPDDAMTKLNAALWTVNFTAGDKTHSLSLFAAPDAEADQYPATSADSDYAFLLNMSRVETFEKQIDALLGK